MQQQPVPQQTKPPTLQDDWQSFGVKIVNWIVLWYLFGPAPYRGYALRKRVAHEGTIWHARRRWTEHTSVALAWPLLCWVILAYLRVPVVVIWGAIFSTVAEWIHVPAFALLGNASLFPPTPGNLLFRWLVCAPLTSLIARTLEQLQPQTHYAVKRVITPQDLQVHLHIEQEEEAQRQVVAAAAKAERARIRASKAARAPKTSTKLPAVQVSGPHIPPPTSLWGSVDWSKVADDDPAKQLMLEELRKLTPQQLADARRAQRLAQAQDVTSAPVCSLPPSQLALPPVAPAQTQESDEYDWDAGNGSISF